MKLLRTFHIGAEGILAKNTSVRAAVTGVSRSYLYVIKKPVRLYPNDRNTRCSHFITFSYNVDAVTYTGKLFVSPHYRCPQKGASIEVFYDPQKPQNYACYAFGPAADTIGR